jgi:hypothetical protein
MCSTDSTQSTCSDVLHRQHTVYLFGHAPPTAHSLPVRMCSTDSTQSACSDVLHRQHIVCLFGCAPQTAHSVPVRTCSTESTQSACSDMLHRQHTVYLCQSQPSLVNRKHCYHNAAEFCKLLKSALYLCAIYFCLFVLNCIHLMWFLHIGIFVAVWKNVRWEGCEPYTPDQLFSNKKHSSDFGELVQKLLSGGVEVVEQWKFSVICSCVLCMQVKPSPYPFHYGTKYF